MPFRPKSVMDERIRFVIEASRRDRSFSELCRSFDISRPTGYLWLNRYDETGSLSFLKEKSRRPLSIPRLTPQVVIDRIVVLRMTYGAAPQGSS